MTAYKCRSPIPAQTWKKCWNGSTPTAYLRAGATPSRDCLDRGRTSAFRRERRRTFRWSIRVRRSVPPTSAFATITSRRASRRRWAMSMRFRSEHAAWLDAARAHGEGAWPASTTMERNSLRPSGCTRRHAKIFGQALRIAREIRNRHAEECAYATAALCYVLSGDLQAARDAVERYRRRRTTASTSIFATAAGSALSTYLGDECC